MLFLIEPEARSANPFGAFVNRNHFAAWLLLVAAPVCGYCIARLRIHPTSRRHWRQSIGQIMSSGAVYTALAAFVQVGVLLVTLSRSAVAGLGVAAVTGWLLGRSRVADRDRAHQAAGRARHRRGGAADDRAVRGRRWLGDAIRAELRPRHRRLQPADHLARVAAGDDGTSG